MIELWGTKKTTVIQGIRYLLEVSNLKRGVVRDSLGWKSEPMPVADAERLYNQMTEN